MMLKNALLCGLVLLTCGIVMPEESFGQDLTYRTTYMTPGGNPIRADLTINGSNGTYRSYNQFGQLVGGGTVSNLQLTNFGGQMVMFGNWQFNGGGQGTLTFRFSQNLRSFTGNWQFAGGGPSRTWNGSYSNGSGQLGNNGPYIGP
ncbi:MAG: hypothetical protein KDA84_16815 [Planctomycetaceae bacterium]|nr:hypothetical protein [Planctomycetaceae bacterium]